MNLTEISALCEGVKISLSLLGDNVKPKEVMSKSLYWQYYVAQCLLKLGRTKGSLKQIPTNLYKDLMAELSPGDLFEFAHLPIPAELVKASKKKEIQAAPKATVRTVKHYYKECSREEVQKMFATGDLYDKFMAVLYGCSRPHNANYLNILPPEEVESLFSGDKDSNSLLQLYSDIYEFIGEYTIRSLSQDMYFIPAFYGWLQKKYEGTNSRPFESYVLDKLASYSGVGKIDSSILPVFSINNTVAGIEFIPVKQIPKLWNEKGLGSLYALMTMCVMAMEETVRPVCILTADCMPFGEGMSRVWEFLCDILRGRFDVRKDYYYETFVKTGPVDAFQHVALDGYLHQMAEYCYVVQRRLGITREWLSPK